ncbi:regulation of nuclear pre-mRNA domain-containing protein 1B-like isoform X2 [Babylonia areolata]|uniref:regulation of nuclear pre-mRNA domain-containing protein 1B-like isoform X2 n=1 Tax=Babylonia areolata TaxID=304850 RepID=UPI003FD09198
MTSFSDANLVKKLSELNNTQQSIQTLSLWLIHHRKHAGSIVKIWHRELSKARPSKRLTFVYLANDIIQNSKKKGPEFAKHFETVLPEAFASASKESEEKTKQSLGRVLNIWQERGVYDKHFIKKVKHAMGRQDSSSKEKTEEKPIPEKQSKKSKKEPELSLLQEVEASQAHIPSDSVDAEELVNRLSDLEHSASCDAAVREKIAALPLEVSDIAHLEKIQDKGAAERLSVQVNEACVLLSEYNQRLVAELEERRKVAFLLRGYVNHVKAQMLDTEKQLEDYKGKLARVSTVRQELLSHIQNLPDLTKLPDVTGGLAPLPSAGDLFSLH